MHGMTDVLLLPVLAWLSYLVVIGGDHFPGLRLLHGVLAPMALLAALALSSVADPRARIIAALVIGIGCSWWNIQTARSDPRSHEARAEVWEWYDKAFGESLKDAFEEQKPRLAVDAAGALPYYSELPAIDMLGLCDRTIATTPFRDWLDTVKPNMPKPPGHLRGNGEHVIAQQPDLIVFKFVLPVFVSGCEFEDDPRFLKNYRLVRVDINQPDVLPAGHLVPMWIRTEGAVGIQRSDRQVRIPGYLFGSFELPGPHVNRHQLPSPDPAFNELLARNGALAMQFWTAAPATARRGEGRGLTLRLKKSGRATLPLSLEKGRYQVRIEPTDHGSTLQVTSGGELRSDELVIAETGVVTLELAAPSDRPASPRRILLDRTR